MVHAADDVVQRDPRPNLLAAAQPPAAELRRQQALLKRPAVAGQDDPQPRVDHADAGLPQRVGGGFPVAGDGYQEVVVVGIDVGFGQPRGAAVAVDSDRRS